MTRVGAALVFAVLAAAPAGAETGGAGSTTGEPLRLARPARDMGMGEAQAATGTGPGAIASNPAGLLDTRLATLHFTHVFQAAETRQEYLAWAQRFPFGPALGFSIFWLYNGGTSRTLEDSNGDYAGQAGSYSVSFGAVSGAVAIDIAELTGLDILRPTAGLAVRAFSQQVDDAKNSGASADLGLRIRPGFGFSLAAVLQNMGSRMAGAGLPRQWVVAGGWEASPLLTGSDAFSIEADLPIAQDRKGSSMLGLEYAFTVGGITLALRGGTKQGLGVPGGAGLTAGVGFRSSAGTFAWGLDYAYQPFGDLGAVQALALTAGFQPKQNL